MISSNINISRIDKAKPAKVMIHSADAKLTVGHIKYWIEPFVESKTYFSILTRDIGSYKKLIELFPKYSILYAKTPIDIESVITAQKDLESIFYTSNMARNIHLLRFNHLKHIFIGSENSDQLSKINKSYRAYDEMYVSGQGQIDKIMDSIKNIGHLKFPIIGKPQLKNIFLKTLDNEPSKTVLYLPSNNKSGSLTLLGVMLLELNDYISYIKLDNSRYAKDINQFSIDNSLDVTIFKDKELLPNILIQSDFIIVDIQNIKVSLLAYNIPIIVYVSEENREDVVMDIPHECLYLFSNKKEFYSIIKSLEKEDALKEKRELMTEYLLGKKETLENVFLTKCK